MKNKKTPRDYTFVVRITFRLASRAMIARQIYNLGGVLRRALRGAGRTMVDVQVVDGGEREASK